jgi:hypothetical protein
MAVEDFGGKVLGKPLEVLVADHQKKPDTASALARKWFDVDKVDMVANLINSSIALSVSQIGAGVWDSKGRASARRIARLDYRYQESRVERVSRPGLDERVLLGPRRRNTCLFQALL